MTATEPMPTARWCLRFLLVWLITRTLLWLVAIVVSHPNAPLDLVEWLSWGHTIQWGYPKHPPLPAWLAAEFARLSPGDVWGVYILGYGSAALVILAAYRLGLRYLPAPLALCAALSLEGLMYLTNDPAEWSNNVALAVGWAWTIVLGEKAIRTNAIGDWLLVGLVIGLTMLCKYTLLVLLLPLVLFLPIDPFARRCLRSLGPYLAVVVALLVFSPHAMWVFEHDLVTLKYAVERSGSTDAWGRLLHPLAFVGGQVVWLIPVLLILLPWRSACRTSQDRQPESDVSPSVSRMYLHFAVLGPVIVLLLLSLTTGCQLREIWGSPLWTFFGVWVLVVGRANWQQKAFRRSLFVAGVVAALLVCFTVTKQAVSPYFDKKGHRPHFPGKQLAEELLARWQTRFPNSAPFPVVAGEGWIAGNACVYSRHRPVLFSSGNMGVLDFDPLLSPWTSDDDLRQRGGVIVWDANQGETLPPAIAQRFPHALSEAPIVLSYRTGAAVPPARIALAIVPPRP